MKAGDITLQEMENGGQKKPVPPGGAPNTRTADEIRAVYEDAARRRAELYRPLDERPD